MAYLRLDQEPLAATIVKYNGNKTFHVRFQNGESDFRYAEQHLMTRDWQPKVRLQPDLLVWMEPSQTKSKTKSHLFSMYKNVEVDEFSGFVLQKLKKDAREAHRAAVRIISGTTYPFWEVAYSDSLEEARSLHWKYIKEVVPTLIPHISKEDRAEWIVTYIKQLLNPVASAETAQALNWLSRAKPQDVDPEFTERLAESINSDSDLLEKDEIQAFLQEWCTHHRVVDVDSAIRDFFERCTKEHDGKIPRKRLVNILTTPVPATYRAPPPPPSSAPRESMIITQSVVLPRESVMEVKLNLDPYLERLHGLVACFLPLGFALGFEVGAHEWLRSTMSQVLSSLMQWTSLTCQTVAGCVKLLEDAFDRFAKTESLMGGNTLGTSRPPKFLIKSIVNATSQAVQDLELLRDLLVRIGQHNVQELQPQSDRAKIWSPIAEEAIKLVKDFIPNGLAAPKDSAKQPSCSCSINANARVVLPPLSEPLTPLPVPEFEFPEIPDTPAPSVVPSPTPTKEPSMTQAQPTRSTPPPPPPPTLPATPASRVLIRVGLPKGFSSTQTKLQVSSSDTAASLKARILTKFGTPALTKTTSWMLLHQSVQVADNEPLGNRDNFTLQPSSDPIAPREDQQEFSPDKLLEAAHYLTQAEEALRAGNESAAQEFFELQRRCLAEATAVVPKSKVEHLTVVHRELKKYTQLAAQYKRDAERYMKAGQSQSAVNTYDLQRDALQRVEELRAELTQLRGESEITVYSGQSPSVKGILELLQAFKQGPNRGATAAALVFNLELGFLPLSLGEAKALFLGLNAYAGIRKLSLHSSNIDDAGICEFAQLCASRQCPLQSSLVYLDLNANSIESSGADAMAQILRNNQVLEYLDVSCNSLSSRGCAAIVRALEENPLSNLKILRLGATGAEESTARAVHGCLSYNFSLTEVALHCNKISESLLGRIAAKLQRRQTAHAREVHAAQWRTFRDEYLGLPFHVFISSITVLLDDFMASDTKENSLRLMVGLRLFPAKLKQIALSLKPVLSRMADETTATVTSAYRRILSAMSFLIKVCRICLRQQEISGPPPVSISTLVGPALAPSMTEPLDPFSALFDQHPLQEMQDWFEVLLSAATTLTDRLWWHLDQALALAESNPSLIQLSLSLLSVTLPQFLQNEEYKAEHPIVHLLSRTGPSYPDVDKKLLEFRAAQSAFLELLFAPEEKCELRTAIVGRLKGNMAKRFAAVADAARDPLFDEPLLVGLAEPQQTVREGGQKTIAGLRELVDDLSIVHDELPACFGSYDILDLYFLEYRRLLRLTLQQQFPAQSVDAGTAIQLLKFLDWADTELADSLGQDLGVWGYFTPEVEDYYAAYSAQSQSKVLSWLDNVIQLDLHSNESKHQFIMEDDCGFTTTPTDAFNTLDRYLNSFLELLPPRCLTASRIQILVDGLTAAITHIHTSLKKSLETGVVYHKEDGVLDDELSVWLGGQHRKSARYIVAQVNNIVRFEAHLDDLKQSFSRKLQTIGVTTATGPLLVQIDDCFELFGDIAAAGVDVLAQAMQLRVAECLQHQFTSKWLSRMGMMGAEEEKESVPDETELVDLLSHLVGSVACSFSRKAFLGEVLKRVFRFTIMEYFECFLLSNLSSGVNATAIFDFMRSQLKAIGLLFDEFGDLIPPRVLCQDIRYQPNSQDNQTEEEVLAIFCGLVTCELDFIDVHFGMVNAKFSQARFIERGLPPVLCVYVLLSMRPDLNFQERCEHLYAFEKKHPPGNTVKSIKDSALAAFLSADPAVRGQQVKQKFVGAKRDAGVQLERAKGLAKSKLKEANAAVQKFKEKRQQAKLEEKESWAKEAKEKIKLWKRK